MESGHLHLEPEEGDRDSRDKKNIASFEKEAKDRAIDFRFEGNFEKLTMHFDEPKLNMILINLLSNAY